MKEDIKKTEALIRQQLDLQCWRHDELQCLPTSSSPTSPAKHTVDEDALCQYTTPKDVDMIHQQDVHCRE